MTLGVALSVGGRPLYTPHLFAQVLVGVVVVQRSVCVVVQEYVDFFQTSLLLSLLVPRPPSCPSGACTPDLLHVPLDNAIMEMTEG